MRMVRFKLVPNYKWDLNCCKLFVRVLQVRRQGSEAENSE